MRATAEAPRRTVIELQTPAEVAARANAARAARARGDGREGEGVAGSNWTIMDGGVTTERSVTEKAAWDAFDDMDWGDV